MRDDVTTEASKVESANFKVNYDVIHSTEVGTREKLGMNGT